MERRSFRRGYRLYVHQGRIRAAPIGDDPMGRDPKKRPHIAAPIGPEHDKRRIRVIIELPHKQAKHQNKKCGNADYNVQYY